MRRLALLALPLVLPLVAACHGPMSTLGTASAPADRVARLGWFMIWLSVAIFALVCVLLVLAVRHHRARDPLAVDLAPRSKGWVVWGGAVMPGAVLGAIFVVALVGLGRFPAPPDDRDLVVHVTGHRWWWEIRYEGGAGGADGAGGAGGGPVVTANELHVPVGRTVRLLLTTDDVIHSFWVPRLQGKMDLNPGHVNDLRLSAERPGRYMGRCAEYCGLQHAHMAFAVVAEPPAAFQRWLAAERGGAREPADSLARAGRTLVTAGVCASCHTIRGTPARGTIGPDLTHLMSRQTLAAGTIPNTPGYLEAWVTDAQAFKPGALMPSLPHFDGAELRAITRYLEGLR
ncbi:MAG TPA: cytochrome c oxidase subunit II [Gemmatimonadales bacterium]|nr:cytochrome c oxidase subunit II [Gemmatimonadales bacterium]